MRDFTNGKAIVNPSSTQPYTVTLPANAFQDLYGNVVNSVTLGIHSGIVLLDSTPVMTPTATPSATFTPTPSLTPTLTPIPLTVTITSPINGSRIKHKTKIAIQASVSDSLGITKVQFYVNSSLVCTKAKGPYTCTWSVPSKIGVKYNILVKAYDVAGNVGTNSIQVTSY
jgi:hypothetical protein